MKIMEKILIFQFNSLRTVSRFANKPIQNIDVLVIADPISGFFYS